MKRSLASRLSGYKAKGQQKMNGYLEAGASSQITPQGTSMTSPSPAEAEVETIDTSGNGEMSRELMECSYSSE